MISNKVVRRGISTLALVALLAPGPVLAQASTLPGAGAAPGDSVVGALMGVACGAGINVARSLPLPIVISVTAVTCAIMMVDGWLSRD